MNVTWPGCVTWAVLSNTVAVLSLNTSKHPTKYFWPLLSPLFQATLPSWLLLNWSQGIVWLCLSDLTWSVKLSTTLHDLYAGSRLSARNPISQTYRSRYKRAIYVCQLCSLTSDKIHLGDRIWQNFDFIDRRIAKMRFRKLLRRFLNVKTS